VFLTLLGIIYPEKALMQTRIHLTRQPCLPFPLQDTALAEAQSTSAMALRLDPQPPAPPASAEAAALAAVMPARAALAEALRAVADACRAAETAAALTAAPDEPAAGAGDNGGGALAAAAAAAVCSLRDAADEAAMLRCHLAPLSRLTRLRRLCLDTVSGKGTVLPTAR
jgi:hypothetical protein